VCRFAAIVAAVAVSFCIKFAWDSLLVFKQSRASNIRKSFFFLLSSALITVAYLVIMFAIAAAGASDKALIVTGWILFGMGYLGKYVIDKRYAFDA
jgi:putative flippase GtrA